MELGTMTMTMTITTAGAIILLNRTAALMLSYLLRSSVESDAQPTNHNRAFFVKGANAYVSIPSNLPMSLQPVIKKVGLEVTASDVL